LSNIRVTYSGLIAFIVGIIGVVTGILFITIVTRRLNPEDLGLWTLIGSLVSYVVIVEPVISYWTSRQIARGEHVGKTALFTSGSFSCGAIIVYSIISFLVAFALKVDFFVLILASALVPLSFINNTLNGIALSYKPQSISYGIVIFEISKLPLGFLLVYLLDLGIIGAILATIMASIAKMIILFIMTRKQLFNTIKYQVIKLWLKLSWIPLYNSLSGLIFTLDVLIYSLITNSLIGLAFWGVAGAVSNIVGHSGQISQALYPKLLASAKKEFAEENLKRLMFFAIPILSASIVFAKPALHMLNPLYINGIYIVYFLAFRTLIYVIMNVFYNILGAYENIDTDKQASFSQYLKSNLFFLPTLNYILSGSYVTILALFLILSKGMNLTEEYNITIWSFILLAVTIPFMIYGLVSVKRQCQILFPYHSVTKFSFIALIASIITHLIMQRTLVYNPSIYDFVPQLIPIVILGGVIYFGLAYAIDRSARDLFKLVLKEIRKK